MGDMTRPRAFIGSSTESAGVAKDAAHRLREAGFDVLGWWDTDAFPNGSMFLDRVLSLPREVDFALFVFGADDETTSRDESVRVTRDNVVLEYGAFTSVLGLERVAVLAEEGVRLPSDQAGLSVSWYSSNADVRRDSLSAPVDTVAGQWQELEAASSPVATAYRRAFAAARLRVELLGRRLAGAGGDVMDPVSLDSQSDAIAAYCEGLDAVEERFWTTTFLTSPFWTGDREANVAIISANERMVRRLLDAADPDHRPIRRLFLLDSPPDEYVQRRLEERIQLRRQDNHRELEAQNRRLSKLRRNMDALEEQSVSTRVAFDDDELFSDLLNLGVISDPMDTEIAIYDDVRVDAFDGGSVAAMTALRSYAAALHIDFENVLLRKAERYFSDLWEKAEPVETLLDGLENARDKARTSIDYQSNWLARYEFGLAEADRDLKVVELSRTREILLEHTGGEQVSSYLDVGTCTGRYPLEFREHVADDGVIVAVDDDTDCFVFAQQKDRDEARDADEQLMPAIQWERRDVTSPTFDVGGPFQFITCMLGTLSHFGYLGARKPPFDDVLQRVLKRLRDLLTDDGLLVLGSWSELAIARRELLGIYSDDDLSRLVRWTPSREELQARLELLDIDYEVVHKGRLDIWQCTRADTGP